MKKLLSTALIAVILSSTMVNTISAAVERRRGVRTSRAGRAGRRAPTGQASRRITRRRRSLPTPQGKTSPEQLRKTAQQAERDAKKLQDDAKKTQTGKVTEQTVVADAKKVEVNIGKIEQQLANLRTWSGDVLPGGYSLEEKNKAFDIAAPYIKESEALKQRIKANQQKVELITTKRYFGLGSPTVNKGKEEEYAQYSKLIKTDEDRLAKLEPVITQQEVIMGKRRSNAIKGAYGVMATAAFIAGADFYTGGAISGAAATQLSAIASNVAYYTSSPISWARELGATGMARLKAGLGYGTGTTSQPGPGGQSPTTPGGSSAGMGALSGSQQLVEAGLKGASELIDEESTAEMIRRIALPGLQILGVIAANEVKKTLLEAFKAGARLGTKTVLSTLYQRVVTLGESPTPNRQKLEKANEALKAELKKTEAKK